MTPIDLLDELRKTVGEPEAAASAILTANCSRTAERAEATDRYRSSAPHFSCPPVRTQPPTHWANVM